MVVVVILEPSADMDQTYPATATSVRWQIGRCFTAFTAADGAAQPEHAAFVVGFTVDLIKGRGHTLGDHVLVFVGGIFGLDSLKDDARVDHGGGIVHESGRAEVLRGGQAEKTDKVAKSKLHGGSGVDDDRCYLPDGIVCFVLARKEGL